MADGIYNNGLDDLGGGQWASGTYRALLLKSTGYTFDKDHVFVSAVTPGSNEISASGYSRQTLGTKVRTVDNTLDRVVYSCAAPTFGTIVAGQTVGAMVLYRFVTSDSDSVLVNYYDLTDFATDGTPFGVVMGANGLLYVDQGA